MFRRDMLLVFFIFIVSLPLAGCGIGAHNPPTIVQTGSIEVAKAQYIQAIVSIEGDTGEYPANVLRGIELLNLSAEQGYAPAQFKLGYFYQTGPMSYDCLKHEAAKAYYWYGKAAEQNFPEAQYELAMMFNPETGSENFVDRSKYVHWMKKAANSGFAKAQYWLGRMYEKGDSVKHDLQSAKLFYKKAAAQGDRLAIKALKALPQ